MNYDFLLFIIFSLFYIMIQDKAAILDRLGKFGDVYQAAWGWIRDGMAKIIRDEEDWEGAWTTHTLIMLNVAAFVYAVSLGYNDIVQSFGFVPAYASEAWRWVTHQFLHANIFAENVPLSLHLLGNMLFLYVFGDNVEKWLQNFRYERMGIKVNIYAGLFLIFGIIAAAVQASIVGWSSTVIMIGASGAISGVLGMYLVLFPENKVIIAGRDTLPASFYLMIWFIGQFTTNDQSIATFAHIGGFVAGVATAYILKRASASNT